MENCRVISIHSYRGGTGKSNITANLGVLLAKNGYKTGLVDMDIQSPGIHAIFGFDSASFSHCLNDYLWGKCDIEKAVYDISEKAGNLSNGALYLLPSSINPGDIARIIQDGYDIDHLYNGLSSFSQHFNLDILLIDTHPGLSEETLLSISLSDHLLVILRPDRQDYQGTSVTLRVASQLSVPKMSIIVNKAPQIIPEKDLREKIEEAYPYPVDAVFYHEDEMLSLASDGVFALKYPSHMFSLKLENLSQKIME